MTPTISAGCSNVAERLSTCGDALQVGRLWTSLADFFIRQALFEKARDVYEEGLTTVSCCYCPQMIAGADSMLLAPKGYC
jgi:hypothetical protein